MKRIIIKSALVLLIALIILLPLAAWATDVDYDAIDEAALPMVAQTNILQASDQFIRAYHQLLVYDHEEYSGDYNYPNLVGSMTAGSAVLFVTGDGEDYGFWLGSLAGYSQLNLGYDEESAKFLALTNDNQPLSNVWHRIGAAFSSGWTAFVWCMSIGVDDAISAAQRTIEEIGAPIFGRAIGKLLVRAIAVIAVIWTAICIMVGSFHFLKTLFFGSFLVYAGKECYRLPLCRTRHNTSGGNDV